MANPYIAWYLAAALHLQMVSPQGLYKVTAGQAKFGSVCGLARCLCVNFTLRLNSVDIYWHPHINRLKLLVCSHLRDVTKVPRRRLIKDIHGKKLSGDNE